MRLGLTSDASAGARKAREVAGYDVRENGLRERLGALIAEAGKDIPFDIAPLDGELSTAEHMADVVEANLISSVTPDIGGQVFNIACGRQTNLLDLLETMQQITDRQVIPRYEAPRPGDIRASVADVGRARDPVQRVGMPVARPVPVLGGRGIHRGQRGGAGVGAAQAVGDDQAHGMYADRVG